MTDHAGAQRLDGPRPTPASARLIVAALGFGALAAALMQTLVIPIQGRLPQLLDTSPTTASWVVTATLLGGAVAMPVAGRVADLVGKRRVLVACAAIFVLGSALCAFSTGVTTMLAGRAMQGMAMGYIPVAISLVREVTPPQMVGTAIAGLSATLGVGAAIGLPLSAWIAQRWDWHALFWVSTALAVLVLIVTIVLVPHIHDGSDGRFDPVGAIGLALGLVPVLVGVTKGNEWGWTNASTIALIAGGIVVLVGWAVFELRHRAPLVDLRTTARRPVLLTNLAAVLIGFGMMAQAIVAPQLLEMPSATGYGLGQSLLGAGLWMAPGGLMMMVLAPVASVLMARIGPRSTLAIGAAVIAVGYLLCIAMMGQAWSLGIALCVASAGVGVAYAAMPTLILENVPMQEAASAVSINTLMRSVGTTLAGAAMTAFLTSQTMSMAGALIPTEGAFRLCFVAAAAITLAGALVALGIPGRRGRLDALAADGAASSASGAAA